MHNKRMRKKRNLAVSVWMGVWVDWVDVWVFYPNPPGPGRGTSRPNTKCKENNTDIEDNNESFTLDMMRLREERRLR